MASRNQTSCSLPLSSTYQNVGLSASASKSTTSSGFSGERQPQTLQVRHVQRRVTFQQGFVVDIDTVKTVRQNPSPQIGDDQILLLRVREKNVHALRVEVAHLRVAEHLDDVQIVRPGDV